MSSASQGFTLSVTGPAFYVAITGNDTTGTGTFANPWRTIAKGLASMSAGSTLFIRGGTYLETAPGNGLAPKSGTPAAWTTISAYQNEIVTVQRSNGFYVFQLSGNIQYVSLENLIVDGGGGNTNSLIVMYDVSNIAPSHIRLSGCTFRNSKNQGIQTFLNASGLTPITKVVNDLQILNCKIHNNGDGLPSLGFEHGMYLNAKNVLIDGCEVYDNPYGLGIQVYLDALSNGPVSTEWCSNYTIRNCKIWNNGRGLASQGTTALLSSCGSNFTISNIVAYQDNTLPIPSGGVSGIRVDWFAANVKILNCTSFNHKNNYSFGATKPIGLPCEITNCVSGKPPTNSWVTNHLYRGNGANPAIVACLNMTSGSAQTDPQFVASSTPYNLRLVPQSPCIDIGTTLAEVPTDLDGVSRPQGAGYDIGAYERVA